jgi:hypothetical protein
MKYFLDETDPGRHEKCLKQGAHFIAERPFLMGTLFPSIHPIERPLIKVTTLYLSSRAHSGFPTTLLS